MPHQLLIRVTLPLAPEQQNDANNILAHDQVQLLNQYHALAVEAINRKTTIAEAKWQIGEQVWLEGKNLLLPYGSAKLAPRCVMAPLKLSKWYPPWLMNSNYCLSGKSILCSTHPSSCLMLKLWHMVQTLPDPLLT